MFRKGKFQQENSPTISKANNAVASLYCDESSGSDTSDSSSGTDVGIDSDEWEGRKPVQVNLRKSAQVSKLHEVSTGDFQSEWLGEDSETHTDVPVTHRISDNVVIPVKLDNAKENIVYRTNANVSSHASNSAFKLDTGIEGDSGNVSQSTCSYIEPSIEIIHDNGKLTNYNNNDKIRHTAERNFDVDTTFANRTKDINKSSNTNTEILELQDDVVTNLTDKNEDDVFVDDNRGTESQVIELCDLPLDDVDGSIFSFDDVKQTIFQNREPSIHSFPFVKFTPGVLVSRTSSQNSDEMPDYDVPDSGDTVKLLELNSRRQSSSGGPRRHSSSGGPRLATKVRFWSGDSNGSESKGRKFSEDMRRHQKKKFMHVLQEINDYGKVTVLKIIK